jgi:hypothetical protein
VRRQGSHHEDPEWIVTDRSEIDAAGTPHFSRGYWSRTLNFLRLLAPEETLKLPFPNGILPRGIKSSIYAAAIRERMRVSVYVRPAAVYICKSGDPDTNLKPPIPFQNHCLVCGALIDPKPGAGKQYVCAGTKKKKSECQKVWRYAREHGISIEQAKQRRTAQMRNGMRRRRVGRGMTNGRNG